MLFRARDTVSQHIHCISTYPREVDFPLQAYDYSRYLFADIINMNDDVMRCYNIVHYTNIISGTAIRCECTSKQFMSQTGFRRLTCVDYYTSDIRRFQVPALSATYLYPAPIGLIRPDNDGIISIGGKPSIITTKINAVIENRSILSFLIRSLMGKHPRFEMPDIAPPPSWTSVATSVVDICTIFAGGTWHTATLADWIFDHDVKEAIYTTLTREFVQAFTRVNKVTYDGRGYAELTYYE